MRIFTRHMAVRFLAPFAFGMGVFSLLVFLGDLFDKMNRLVSSPASAWVIAQYLLLEIPYWSIRIVPLATLLATLFAVSGFIQRGELTAVQASGFRPGEFFRPLLWLSLGVAVGSFALQEALLPVCYRRAQTLWRERIHPRWEWNKYFDVVLLAGPERFVTTTLFQVSEGTLERPVMDDYGPRGLLRQIDARSARFDARRGAWVFENGIERRFGADGSAMETPFLVLESDLRLAPSQLIPGSKNPDEMSIREARLALRRSLALGESGRELRMAVHAKYAYPLTNVVLCAVGIPIALRLRRVGRAGSFALALLVGFLYLWVIEMTRALGNAGRAPPLLLAWLPNAGFGLAAAWLYGRQEG